MEIQKFCAAVIPCFNEAANIGEVVRETLRHVAAVWVIDDGSSDGSRAVAERAGAVAIRHEVNQGKGASLRDGFQAVRAAGYRWAVTLDGDGQHDPAEIPILIQTAERLDCDMVIGNRMESCSEMPAIRQMVNRWMSTRLEKAAGLKCPDSQCGFRLLCLDALTGLTLRQNRFEVESEMLLAFARAGLKVEFVPVKCMPAHRRSRIHPIGDAIRWFRWWFGAV